MADLQSVESALKIVTPFKELLTAWQDEQKLLKWIPTRKDFYGRHMEVPIGYGPGGGNSYNFQHAQRMSTNARKYDHFEITRVSNYTLLYLDNEAIEASESGDGAYLETYKAELEGANITNAQRLACDIHGDGSGVIGVISAITGPGPGAVLALTDPEKIVHYEIGMQLQAVAAAGTSVRLGNPGYVEITAVNEADGEITIDDSTYITGLTTTDQLVPVGNFNGAIKGIRAYIPFLDAELAASPILWGMTRTAHPERQAGRRFDGSTYSLGAAVELGFSQFGRGNAYPEVGWVNDRYFTAYSLELGAKAARETVRVGQFGFDTIKMFANGRTVQIMSDRNVPDGYMECLKRDTWVFHTLKDAPRYLTPQGAKQIVKPTDDGVETRWGWRGQLICRKPSDNGIIKLPALS